MSSEDVIKVLNGLIHVAQDGREGFAEAAGQAIDTGLKSMFAQCSHECALAADELQLTVKTLGGEPARQGSVAGAAHRGWIKLKSAVAESNVAVLEEVERGEDHARSAYAKALKTQLPPAVRLLVERQSQGVHQIHQKVRYLRNQYRAAA